MIIKNIKYIQKFINDNELDIPTFCKQCKITKETFNSIFWKVSVLVLFLIIKLVKV